MFFWSLPTHGGCIYSWIWKLYLPTSLYPTPIVAWTILFPKQGPKSLFGLNEEHVRKDSGCPLPTVFSLFPAPAWAGWIAIVSKTVTVSLRVLAHSFPMSSAKQMTSSMILTVPGNFVLYIFIRCPWVSPEIHSFIWVCISMFHWSVSPRKIGFKLVSITLGYSNRLLLIATV